MHTALHHIIAQLRIEEMRHEAERVRRAEDLGQAGSSPDAPPTPRRRGSTRQGQRRAAPSAGPLTRPGNVPR